MLPFLEKSSTTNQTGKLKKYKEKYNKTRVSNPAIT